MPRFKELPAIGKRNRIRHCRYLQFRQRKPQTAEQLDADAVIFPPELLGTLAERRLIRPLNRAWLTSDLLAADDLLTPLDSPELCWDGQPTAIPLGEPVLLAFYRTDVLERLGKTPPNTWDEYQQLVDQIGREHHLRPTAEPLAGGWAARLLLARAAAYARHRDYLSVLFNRETMEPLIAGSPFVRALEELVQTAKLNPAGAAELTPQQCVDLVINGEAAMAIGFLDRRTKTLPTSSIAVAELPGSDTAYHWGQARWEPRRADETGRVTLRGLGGRIGAVVRGSDHAESAFLLLSWLASKHGSEELMSADLDSQPFRVSQLAAPSAGCPNRSILLWQNSMLKRFHRQCVGRKCCGCHKSPVRANTWRRLTRQCERQYLEKKRRSKRSTLPPSNGSRSRHATEFKSSATPTGAV